ncbi:alternative oxidase [Phanerochaete sordida]|uniref:Alternative oxidase n=1 Tax=Phanerochaete sordida TaxID=48140 RepID=A0A9P3GNQ3_9APHY|nr:alternative oxidase [Phanerochaete sordida]
MLRTVCTSTALRASSQRLVLTPQAASRLLVATYPRAFSTSTPSRNALSAKPTDEKAVQGTEGLHRRDLAPQHPAAVEEALTHPDAVSPDAVKQAPLIRGDWVLFHPVYSDEELKAVKVVHRDPTTLPDKVARALVRFARRSFDFVSGYKEKHVPPAEGLSLEQLRRQGYALTEHQWLSRILFLESIAGVPGMVAATLRHLRSLRLMRRDAGWIHTLLEEAENERMHLMTFMTIRKPSIFFRALVLGAQGVFYNAFFLSYLVSPKICHRFVAYLEEEAVHTYTRCISDLEQGRIPEWENVEAPEIAKDYWRLRPDAKMIDVLYAVRSDESTHRFVNHSLANLNPSTDINPFALREPDMHVKGTKLGFERSESEEYVQESHKLLGRH